MFLKIVRYNLASDYTLGLVFLNDKYFCDSLERPWLDNTPFISCIPIGKYAIELREDPNAHNNPAYIIKDVPGRTNIEMHAANAVSELEGCIAIGFKTREIIYSSKSTLESLIRKLGAHAVLEIEDIKL